MEGLGIHRQWSELQPLLSAKEKIKATFSNFGHKESKEGRFYDAKRQTKGCSG
jgi:hypothetical protein